MAYSSVIYGSAEANSKVLTGKWCAYPAPPCWGEVPKADGIHFRERETKRRRVKGWGKTALGQIRVFIALYQLICLRVWCNKHNNSFQLMCKLYFCLLFTYSVKKTMNMYRRLVFKVKILDSLQYVFKNTAYGPFKKKVWELLKNGDSLNFYAQGRSIHTQHTMQGRNVPVCK